MVARVNAIQKSRELILLVLLLLLPPIVDEMVQERIETAVEALASESQCRERAAWAYAVRLQAVSQY